MPTLSLESLCASESPENVVFRFFSRLSSCYGTVSSLNGEPEQGCCCETGQSIAVFMEKTPRDGRGREVQVTWTAGEPLM